MSDRGAQIAGLPVLGSAIVSGQEVVHYRAIVCLSSIKTADVGEQKAQRRSVWGSGWSEDQAQPYHWAYRSK